MIGWTCACGNNNSRHRATCLACHKPRPPAAPPTQALPRLDREAFESFCREKWGDGNHALVERCQAAAAWLAARDFYAPTTQAGEAEPHQWVLIADDDPKETELCIACGAQRDKDGPLAERGQITGGWAVRDCSGAQRIAAFDAARSEDEAMEAARIAAQENDASVERCDFEKGWQARAALAATRREAVTVADLAVGDTIVIQAIPMQTERIIGIEEHTEKPAFVGEEEKRTLFLQGGGERFLHRDNPVLLDRGEPTDEQVERAAKAMIVREAMAQGRTREEAEERWGMREDALEPYRLNARAALTAANTPNR